MLKEWDVISASQLCKIELLRPKIDTYKPVAQDHIALTKLMMRNIHIMVTLIGDNDMTDEWKLKSVFNVNENDLRYSHKM